jgi:hypothetical protein
VEAGKEIPSGFDQVSGLFEKLITTLEDGFKSTNEKFDGQREAMMEFLLKNSHVEEGGGGGGDEDEGEKRERER